MHALALALGLFVAVQGEAPAAEHPMRLDRTGIVWEIPFTSARERAAKERRLLAIKPVAFGTTAGGCW